MCGIAGGCWKVPPQDSEHRMMLALRCLRHRGPNDQGVDIREGPGYTVALGQTRLSIIDLSPGGHQPMHMDGEDLSIVFNGEIYNYKELRDELRQAGHSFR